MERFESLQPLEERQFEFDFTNKLGTATVASATTTGKIVSTGVDVSATLLTVGKQSLSGQSVYLWVVGLTDGTDYQITCKAVGSDGQKVELEGLVLCSSVPATAETATTGPGCVVGPIIEPVSLAEMKDHLRVDGSDEDEEISLIAISARRHVENITRRALLTQTWDYCLNAWPSTDRIKLPNGRLQSVTSVKWKGTDGTETTLTSGTDYLVETNGDGIGRVVLPYGMSWPSGTLYPSNPITIRFICGWTTAEKVPHEIRAAVKFAAENEYYHGDRAEVLLPVISRLLSSYQLWDEFTWR